MSSCMLHCTLENKNKHRCSSANHQSRNDEDFGLVHLSWARANTIGLHCDCEGLAERARVFSHAAFWLRPHPLLLSFAAHVHQQSHAKNHYSRPIFLRFCHLICFIVLWCDIFVLLSAGAHFCNKRLSILETNCRSSHLSMRTARVFNQSSFGMKPLQRTLNIEWLQTGHPRSPGSPPPLTKKHQQE